MTPTYQDASLAVYQGDALAVLAQLPAESVHCVVTSPPYWGLRDYGHPDQLGLEPTPELYVEHLVAVFREVRRVLRADGTVWLNLGDTYTPQSTHRSKGERGGMNQRARGLRDAVPQAAYGKPKDLVGIPWRVAFALQADGWYLRADVVWSKPNPMPESVTDRPVKSHEYVFLLARSPRYFYDAEAVREPGSSGPSDVRKMLEGRERIGGLGKAQTDPMLAVSGLTRIGRTRAVGGAPMKLQPHHADGARERRVAGFNDRWDAAEKVGVRTTRNRRTVWTIATETYQEAHFATYPTRLVEPCILAGTSEHGVCPDCGAPWIRELEREGGRSVAGPKSQAKRDAGLGTAFSGYEDGAPAPVYRTVGWHPGCRHGGRADDLEVIASPLGEGQGGEYHRARLTTARRGPDRERLDDEGRRPMYRWEQRAFAEQLRRSPHRDAMAAEAGGGFDHYTRSDRSGARAIPPALLEAWTERGWLEWPTETRETPEPVPAVVLDPFGGSGTTALVAERLGRRAVLVELSPEYVALALERVAQGRRDGAGPPLDMDLAAPSDSLWAAI